MTELYTAFSLTLLIRYLHDQEYCPRIRKLDKFEHLPPKVHKKFLAICKLASEGISNNHQLIFSDLPDDFETLGFMQSVPELHISSGVSVSYNFLHLTIQEFLAAYHLSLQPEEVQKDSISTSDSYWFRPTKSASAGIVTKFLAGITRLENVLNKQLPVPSSDPVSVEVPIENFSRYSLLHVTDSFTSNYITYFNTRTRPELKVFGSHQSTEVKCHVSLNIPHCTWLYESQNINMLQTCLGCKTALIKITSGISPMDCFAAGWCIGNSTCEWKLFFLGEISLDCIEMLHAGLMLSTSSPDKKVCELCYVNGPEVIPSNPETQKTFSDFLNAKLDIVKISCYGQKQLFERQLLFGKFLASLIEKSFHLKELELFSLATESKELIIPLNLSLIHI